MGCLYLGDLNNVGEDAGVSAGVETEFPRARREDFDGTTTNFWEEGESWYSPNYNRNFFWAHGGGDCAYRILAITYESQTTEGENGEELVTWGPTKMTSTESQPFPFVPNMEFKIFDDFVNVRGNEDRPGQYDNFWQPYIITVPFSGDTWRFTSNTDIPPNIRLVFMWDHS